MLFFIQRKKYFLFLLSFLFLPIFTHATVTTDQPVYYFGDIITVSNDQNYSMLFNMDTGLEIYSTGHQAYRQPSYNLQDDFPNAPVPVGNYAILSFADTVYCEFNALNYADCLAANYPDFSGEALFSVINHPPGYGIPPLSAPSTVYNGEFFTPACGPNVQYYEVLNVIDPTLCGTPISFGTANNVTYELIPLDVNMNVMSPSVFVEAVNDVPSIDSISPSSVIVGNADLALIISGLNFSTSSVIKWNSNEASTSFVDENTLTAIISASEISSVGTSSVSVFDGETKASSTDFIFTVFADVPRRRVNINNDASLSVATSTNISTSTISNDILSQSTTTMIDATSSTIAPAVIISTSSADNVPHIEKVLSAEKFATTTNREVLGTTTSNPAFYASALVSQINKEQLTHQAIPGQNGTKHILFVVLGVLFFILLLNSIFRFDETSQPAIRNMLFILIISIIAWLVSINFL